MNIKYATNEDIAEIATVEAECFPPAEAATEKEFVERVKYYGKHFWLMYEAGKLIAFVDGVDFIIYSFYNYFIKRVQRGT